MFTLIDISDNRMSLQIKVYVICRLFRSRQGDSRPVYHVHPFSGVTSYDDGHVH
jgi:hypothetical protein